MKRFNLLLLCLLAGVSAFSQFNPATNGFEKMENPVSQPLPVQNDGAFAGLAGVPCSPNSFWGVAGGQITSFTLNGNTVTSNGNVTAIPGNGLAYCNNLDGEAFSPTFYSNTTPTKTAYYTGTGWKTSAVTPKSWIVNAGGYGNYLFFTANDSSTFRQTGITRYNGSSYAYVYTIADTGRAITVADLAVDESGNVWFFTGVHYSLITDTLNVMSPSGQMIKQYPFALNTLNAYGCFLLNGTIYIGLGSANLVHPYTLIPVVIYGNTASAGTPIAMPQQTFSDLASCIPGSPFAVNEKQVRQGINLYPNPVRDILYIDRQGGNGQPMLLQIVNDSGETVLRETIANTHESIDISGLLAGIYLVLADGESRKIVKQ